MSSSRNDISFSIRSVPYSIRCDIYCANGPLSLSVSRSARARRIFNGLRASLASEKERRTAEDEGALLVDATVGFAHRETLAKSGALRAPVD